MNYRSKKTVSMEPCDFHSFSPMKGTEEDPANSPLESTSYFRTERAKAGFIWLLRKCDNYHLIVPPLLEKAIEEMLTGKYAQVCHGTSKTIISFDDLSGVPMVTYFDSQQILGMFDDAYDKPKRKGFLAIYKKGKEHPDDIADECIEVGRMDLWVNRTFGSIDYIDIRKLTEEQKHQYLKNHRLKKES